MVRARARAKGRARVGARPRALGLREGPRIRLGFVCHLRGRGMPPLAGHGSAAAAYCEQSRGGREAEGGAEGGVVRLRAAVQLLEGKVVAGCHGAAHAGRPNPTRQTLLPMGVLKTPDTFFVSRSDKMVTREQLKRPRPSDRQARLPLPLRARSPSSSAHSSAGSSASSGAAARGAGAIPRDFAGRAGGQ